MANYNAENIVNGGWFYNGDKHGAPSWEVITALASLRAVDRLTHVVRLLGSIHDLLVNLGRDGIHEVIRELAYEAKAKQKRRRRDARRKRARAKVLSPRRGSAFRT